jgi:ferritin-like metal-binding protein YciE
LQDQLVKYLTDVHSTEQNALSMLRAGVTNVDDAELEAAFREHLAETEEHERLVKQRLEGYAFEHLEIASYRMLRQVAERAGDEDTVLVADRILAQERAAAEKLSGLLERVADHDLAQMGLAV